MSNATLCNINRKPLNNESFITLEKSTVTESASDARGYIRAPEQMGTIRSITERNQVIFTLPWNGGSRSSYVGRICFKWMICISGAELSFDTT